MFGQAMVFAVGMRNTAHPHTERYGRISRIRLPPPMFDGEARARPTGVIGGMGSNRSASGSIRAPVVPVRLAASPKRRHSSNLVPECRQRLVVGSARHDRQRTRLLPVPAASLLVGRGV